MPGQTQLIRIKEDSQIKRFLSFLSYDTSVILFDLDNTVGWPGTYVGSDQWFMKLFEYFGKFINNKEELSALAVAVYHEVQRHSEMEAVEPLTIQLIHYLQTIGYPIIAITSRGEELEQATYQQLTSIGIHFDEIIFCSGKNKGEEILKWINHHQPNWKKAVMIDDNEKNLRNVSQALALLAINFQGLRYSKMDTFFGKQDTVNNVHKSLVNISYFSEQLKSSLEPIMAKYTDNMVV